MRLVALAVRRSSLTLVVGISLLLALGTAGSWLTSGLKTTGFETSQTAESNQAAQLLTQGFGFTPDPALVLLISSQQQVSALPVRKEVDRIAAVVREDPSVGEVQTYLDGPRRQRAALTARNQRSTAMLIYLQRGNTDTAVSLVQRLKPLIRSNLVRVRFGGYGATFDQYTSVARADLLRTEALTLPFVFLVLALLLGSWRLALVPFSIGVFAVVTTSFVVGAVSKAVDVSFFALNIASALGLALAIDSGLLVLFRFQEELSPTVSREEALTRAYARSGKPILFSSLTLAACLGALLLFPQPLVRSMGIGGLAVALATLASVFTIGPAIMIKLSSKITSTQRREPSPRWERLTRWVMKHPVPIAGLCLLIMIAAGLPFLRFAPQTAGAASLPPSQEARQVNDLLKTEFAPGLASPITIAVRSTANPPRAAHAAESVARQARHIPGVGTVELHASRSPQTTLVDVLPKVDATSPDALKLVRDIRGLAVPNAQTFVGGQAAIYQDFNSDIMKRAPIAVALVVLVAFLLIALLTGSIALPIKSLIANALTISACFGILVITFQDGQLASLLNLRDVHGIDSTTAVVLGALVFGLSTDYGVFLMGRIKEFHDSGLPDQDAVPAGIATTGRVITAAALVFACAVGPLVLSRIYYIQQIGLGVVAAVLLDAFVIRLLLTPALMQLLGSANWWAPRALRFASAALGRQRT